MKLLYIANSRIPTEKAHGVQIMKMCEAFANYGVELELIIPKRKNLINNNPFAYYSLKENFKLKKLPCLDLVDYGRFGFYIQSLSFALSVFFYTFFKKSYIIYSRDELPLYFLSFIKRKIFWETHAAKWNFISRRVLAKSSGIISITNGLKDFFIHKGVEEKLILVAPDGVDLDDFNIKMSKEDIRDEMALPKDKKIVSYIGKFKTMGVEKGVNNIIKAFSLMLRSRSDIFLLLVGANESEIVEIKNIMASYNIDESHYKIVSHVSRRKVVYYMKSSDILVMNYPRIEHYEKYMSPLKLFEYMASGVPIVTSNLASLREILNEKNSIRIPPDDVERLSYGIEKVLTNNNFCKKISKQALLDVENYTWLRRVKKILQFINTKA